MTLLILGILLGVQAGWWSRDIREKLTSLLTPKSVPSVGVTRGSYKRADELANSSAVISPKTPQKIEFETEEEIRKAGYR